MLDKEKINKAIDLILASNHTTVFTGAGISVESGIPPFRGKDGLWSKYDPIVLDISYFYANPGESWEVIREIFYEFCGKAKPNYAHKAIAELERKGFVKAVITQNIDGLHQQAGSKNVYEFHGTSQTLVCTECGKKFTPKEINLNILPPRCDKCGGLIKPDFIFFGEPIPEPAGSRSFAEAEKADLFILVGTSGEIMPASIIPFNAKDNGAKIIEINKEPSKYTAANLPDVFLEGKATEVFNELMSGLNSK
jgi:NAD-dependent deacetylase